MKKILLTIALVAFAFTTRAQLVLSANIGGAYSSGNTITHTQVSIVGDYEYFDTTLIPSSTTFTGGLKIGYKFGKAQVGLAGSYSMYTLQHQPLDPTLVPIIANQLDSWTSVGEMTTKGASYTISPYFRYDFLTAGDVSLFAELSFFYTSVLNPSVTASVLNQQQLMGVPTGVEFTWDTADAVVPRNSTSWGVRLTPGLSWQLTRHCGFDLYLDFLSLAYAQVKTQRTDLAYNFRVTASGTTINVVYDYTTTVTNSSTTEYGGGFHGTPLLTEQGVENWVRVGFNFTF